MRRGAPACKGSDKLKLLTFDDLPPLGEGEIVAEKYRVERVLGVGGVGVVVSAMHVALGQRVALKFLRRSAAENADAVERFLREARAAVRLKSQHAVRVLDVGTVNVGRGDLEGGGGARVPYMVMELLDGCDFGTILEKRGQLPSTEAVSYVLQACEALAEAHAAGIVHRDLKPENLFMTTGVDHRPLVKVLDFGLAKEMSQPGVAESGRSLTGPLAMGTPAYMSPEQIKSTRDVDARADIWSLGAVLYELVSGRLPFDAQSLPELIAAIVRDPPRPLRELAPHVPEKLVAVIARCLEKNPADRYPKISKLAAALEEFSGDDASLGTGARLALVQPSAMPPPTPHIAWLPSATVAQADHNAQHGLRATAESGSRVTWTAQLPATTKRRASLWALLLLAVCGLGSALYAFGRPSRPTVVVAERSTSSDTSTASAASIEAPLSLSSASPTAPLTAPPSLSPIPTPIPTLIPTLSAATPTTKPGKMYFTTAPKNPGPVPKVVPKEAPVHDDRLLETR
jgi:eukaryotic-like serine/threonine-protein kinase